MQVYVIADYHSWMTPIPGRIDGRQQHNTAKRGDRITVTDEEANRGIDLGTLSVDPVDLVTVEAEALEPVSWEDPQLRSANVAELIAYMAQRPSEAERVLELEQAQSRPRKGVLEAGERIVEARDAELQRLADQVQNDADATADEAAERHAAPATA